MARKSQRIETGGGSDLSADNPFAALSGEGLKPAPAPVAEGSSAKSEKPRKRETLLLRKLKAGKGGKTVTEISGFDSDPASLADLLKQLQARLGTGGTRKGKALELQGDWRAELRPLLEGMGYRVKG